MTSTRATSTRATRAMLNRLITACNDGARAQHAASVIMRSNERRAWLEDSASRRLAFADELGELVLALGAKPTRAGSTAESLRAAGHWVRTLVVGEHGGDAYASCARIEATAEQLYGLAKDAELSGAARLTIARQYAEIATDSLELRRLSMGGCVTRSSSTLAD